MLENSRFFGEGGNGSSETEGFRTKGHNSLFLVSPTGELTKSKTSLREKVLPTRSQGDNPEEMGRFVGQGGRKQRSLSCP